MSGLSRSNDPATSHAAGHAAAEKIPRMYSWALKMVRQDPGRTQAELGRKYCLKDHRKIGRLLCGMWRVGLVLRGLPRRDDLSEMLAYTWYPWDWKGPGIGQDAPTPYRPKVYPEDVVCPRCKRRCGDPIGGEEV